MEIITENTIITDKIQNKQELVIFQTIHIECKLTIGGPTWRGVTVFLPR